MITWNPSYETGIGKVDEQHRGLVDQINRLQAAMMKRNGSQMISSILKFLEQYAVEHFSAEELLMRDYNYPGYETHKKLHDEFKADFLALAAELASNTASSHLTLEVENRLSKWLLNHILRVDKEAMRALILKGAS